MSASNRRGVGFAGYPYDESDDQAVLPYKPPAPAPVVNPTAELVTASLSAQAPTGSGIKPAVLPEKAKVIYFSDEGQPYRPSEIAEKTDVEQPVGEDKLLKYAGIGLIGYALYRLFR